MLYFLCLECEVFSKTHSSHKEKRSNDVHSLKRTPPMCVCGRTSTDRPRTTILRCTTTTHGASRSCCCDRTTLSFCYRKRRTGASWKTPSPQRRCVVVHINTGRSSNGKETQTNRGVTVWVGGCIFRHHVLPSVMCQISESNLQYCAYQPTLRADGTTLRMVQRWFCVSLVVIPPLGMLREWSDHRKVHIA